MHGLKRQSIIYYSLQVDALHGGSLSPEVIGNTCSLLVQNMALATSSFSVFSILKTCTLQSNDAGPVINSRNNPLTSFLLFTDVYKGETNDRNDFIC